MSSSRSLASARTKRATGNNPTVPIESLPSQQQQPNATPSHNTKLSLPEAFSRIGDRLNTLELFAETTTGVVNDIQEFHSNTSDKYIVDKDVFTSIVGRIDTLEGVHSEKSNNVPSASSYAPSSEPMMLKDIDELKTHLIRLQTYVMETNAKLQDLVFHKNGASLVNFDDVFSDSHPTPPTLMQKVVNQSNNEDDEEEDRSVGVNELTSEDEDNIGAEM